MAKAIHKQSKAIANTLAETISASGHLLTIVLGPEVETRFPQVKEIHIVVCGASYHAGLVVRYWIESLAIFNMLNSSLVLKAGLRLTKHAGPEIGVASTKAFTTQLKIQLWLTGVLAKSRGFLQTKNKT